METVNFHDVDLSKLLYIKVTYTDLENKPHEIKTEAKFISDKYISVFFRYEDKFEIAYPQKVDLQFVCDGSVYVADSTLHEIKRTNTYVFLNFLSPAALVVKQNRKYHRIKLDRVCILLATNKDDNCEAYMSRLIDISAGGVLIHKLESMYNSSVAKIEPQNYKHFNVVLILGLDTILKLSARFVRQEQTEKSQRYAFEFIDVAKKDRDTMCKFVTHEEVERLILHKKTQ